MKTKIIDINNVPKEIVDVAKGYDEFHCIIDTDIQLWTCMKKEDSCANDVAMVYWNTNYSDPPSFKKVGI